MRKVIYSSMNADIAEILKRGKAECIGFEERHLSVATLKNLKKLVKARWAPSHMIEEMRLIKDESEVRIIEKNFRILSKVFKKIPEILKAGKKEKEVAAELEYSLKMEGGEGNAFDFIVASGKKSALVHGVAGNRKIGKSDFVLLDWGCLLNGYHTDNTRNFSLGKPGPKMKKIFDIVLEANTRAIQRVRPGVSLKEVDSAARDFIKRNGFGKYFGHGTGHGVGLDIHEDPSVNQKSEMDAREGMVFTVEPGIYIPGLGGVRIEDMVLVTSKGCRVLSKNIPKELIVL